MAATYQHYLESLTENYTTGDFYRETYNAKQEYFSEFGAISEDEVDFENQMDIFMSWYLFDRNLSTYELSPVKLFFHKQQGKLTPEQLVYYENLTKTVHSIFELTKKKEDHLLLKELGTKKKFKIKDPFYHNSFSVKDIFEARVIPNEEFFCFANGFCLHPSEAKEFISDKIKKIRYQDTNQRDKFLLRLNHMKIKHLRYPHIDVKHVYTLDPYF